MVKIDSNKNHSMVSNILFHIKVAKKWDSILFYFQILYAIPAIAGTYMGVLLPARLVEWLEHKTDIYEMMIKLFTLAFVMWACNVITFGMHQYMYRNGGTLTMCYDSECFKKMMQLPYEKLEDAETQKIIGNTWNVLRNEFGIRNSVEALPNILTSTAGVVWYGYMVGSKSLIMLLLATVSIILSTWFMSLLKNIHKKYHSDLGRHSKETAYINRQAMESSSGKDIRIYKMKDWLLDKYDKSLNSMESIYRKIHNFYFIRGLLDLVMLIAKEGFSYIYLLILVYRGQLSISEFVLYMGLFGLFSNYLNSMISTMMQLITTNTAISYVREFIELMDESSSSKITGKQIDAMNLQGIKLEFKNVSYQYTNTKSITLNNINMIIHPGEKVALLGLNGSGKTTFVKLACGLYKPTSGNIYINDLPIENYTAKSRNSLISVLFQDSSVLPMTLEQNLTGALQENYDRNKLEWALNISGFAEKYHSLPNAGNTLLVKEVNNKATDLSGGEKQKLLFTRALYQKTSMIILDEPTAALDPIAENELYMKYSEATQNRTALFISHRLSSTRFCDRIILLENGILIEEGTHDTLMSQGGRYAELYKIQSKYYQDDKESEDGYAVGEKEI